MLEQNLLTGPLGHIDLSSKIHARANRLRGHRAGHLPIRLDVVGADEVGQALFAEEAEALLEVVDQVETEVRVESPGANLAFH